LLCFNVVSGGCRASFLCFSVVDGSIAIVMLSTLRLVRGVDFLLSMIGNPHFGLLFSIMTGSSSESLLS
jgi:hypothetical protein